MNVELLKSKVSRLNSMLLIFGRSVASDVAKDEEFVRLMEKSIDGIGKISAAIKSSAKICTMRANSVFGSGERSPSGTRFKKEDSENHRKPSSPENISQAESECIKKPDKSHISNEQDEYPINLQFGKVEVSTSRIPSALQKITRPESFHPDKHHYSFDISTRNSVHRIIGGRNMYIFNDLNGSGIANEESSAKNNQISSSKNSFLLRNEFANTSTDRKVSSKRKVVNSMLSDKDIASVRKPSFGFSDLIKNSQIKARTKGTKHNPNNCLSDRTENEREYDESGHVTIYDDKPEVIRHISSKSDAHRLGIKSRASNIVANFESGTVTSRQPSRSGALHPHRRTISSVIADSTALVTPYKDRVKNIIKNQIKISINDLN